MQVGPIHTRLLEKLAEILRQGYKILYILYTHMYEHIKI